MRVELRPLAARVWSRTASLLALLLGACDGETVVASAPPPLSSHDGDAASAPPPFSSRDGEAPIDASSDGDDLDPVAPVVDGGHPPEPRKDGGLIDATDEDGPGCSGLSCGQSPLLRNVILLLGDGMGQEHWDAARARAGRPLAVDDMSGPVFYTTHSTGNVVTDSAASATAMATGHCTLNGRLGISPEGAPLETLLELARRSGKRTGLVTNSYVIDASPMAFAAHVASRSLYGDITEQLLTVTRPDLVFGGWIPPELLAPALSIEQTAWSNGYAVAYDMTEASLAPADAPLLGLFGRGPSSPSWPEWAWGLTPESLRVAPSDEPTVEEMTRFALERLGDTPDGFFLLVESELADTIGHDSQADPTLAVTLMPDAVLELDRAISAVLKWTRAASARSETLVLVWSDHETGYYSVSDGGPSAATFSTASHTPTPVPAYTLDPRPPTLEQIRHVTDLHAFVTATLTRGDAGSGCP